MTLNDILSAPRKPVALDGAPGLTDMIPSLATANAPLASMTPSPAIASATSLRDLIPSTDSRLASAQQGLQQAQMHVNQGFGTANNHPGFLGKALHGLSVAGNIAGNIFAPETLALIPGTQLNNQMKVAQAQNELSQAQTQKTSEVAGAATANEKGAKANKENTQADDMKPFLMSKEQAHAINQDDLAGTQTTMRDYGGQLKAAGRNEVLSENNAATNATRVQTTGMKADASTANNAATNDSHESIADAANKTHELIASAHDATSRSNTANRTATSRANNANTNDHKGMTAGGGAGGGSFKVPADVTKRAALASNVLENADAVEGLITKRPDMIGSAGGRYSNVQQMIGSDDPDIQALGVRMHNMALASNGAHGVRAQQAIQKTEDELYGHFKAGPNAIRGALNATRGSMQTFLDDEKNFSTTGQRRGNGTPPSSGGGIPAGISVTAPDGSVHPFENQKQADTFKKLAGIK